LRVNERHRHRRDARDERRDGARARAMKRIFMHRSREADGDARRREAACDEICTKGGSVHFVRENDDDAEKRRGETTRRNNAMDVWEAL